MEAKDLILTITPRRSQNPLEALSLSQETWGSVLSFAVLSGKWDHDTFSEGMK